MSKSRRPKAPTTAPRVPPQDPPLFTHKPQDILKRTDELLQHRVDAQQRIPKDPAAATFNNTIIPLVTIDQEECLELGILTNYQDVSANLELQRASRAASKLIEEYRTPDDLLKTLSLVIDAVVKRSEKLDPESQKLLEHFSRRFEVKNDSSKKKEDRSSTFKKRRLELCWKIRENLMKEDGILFTLQELDGVPSSIVDWLPKEADRFFVNFSLKCYCDVMNYAKNSETRKRLYLGGQNSGVFAKNVPLFKEVFILRDKDARLYGDANHATWRLEQMAYGDIVSINENLRNLRSKISMKATEEIKKMKEIKRADSDDTHFYPWDYQFYDRIIKEKEVSFDPLKVAEYFEVVNTVREMLKVFEELFSLVFEKAISKKRELYWHQDVELYHVWNSNSRGGEFVGYLYLDLYFRDDKDVSPRTVSLQPGFTDARGNQRYPVTVLITGIRKPIATDPTLLNQKDVLTILHELGHAIHYLVSRTKYARFHAGKVAVDFGELSGLMLENWGWNRVVIGRLNKHYSSLSSNHLGMWQDQSRENVTPPKEKMPREMVTSLLESRRVNAALSRSLFLTQSLFDIAVHSPESHQNIVDMNISELYNRLLLEVSGFDAPPGQGQDWGSGAGSMAHLIENYDAVFYCYLISEVYAVDLFNCLFKKDPMDKTQGQKYRDKLLAKGASEDGMEMLVEYLGRKPIFSTFFQELGII